MVSQEYTTSYAINKSLCFCTDVSLHQPCNFPSAASDSSRDKRGSELILSGLGDQKQDVRLEARDRIIRAQSQSNA